MVVLKFATIRHGMRFCKSQEEKKKEAHPCEISVKLRRRDLIHYGIAAIETGGEQQSTGLLDLILQIPPLL